MKLLKVCDALHRDVLPLLEGASAEMIATGYSIHVDELSRCVERDGQMRPQPVSIVQSIRSLTASAVGESVHLAVTTMVCPNCPPRVKHPSTHLLPRHSEARFTLLS